MLSDLRESGAIEQDADIVCFLHRPDLYSKKSEENGEGDDPFKARIVEVIIAKQRNGPTGSFEMVFLPNYTRFEEQTTYQFVNQVSSKSSNVSENEDDYMDEEPPVTPF
jgi:replicative DNA helicase